MCPNNLDRRQISPVLILALLVQVPSDFAREEAESPEVDCPAAFRTYS
jgi:hypothetical protein